MLEMRWIHTAKAIKQPYFSQNKKQLNTSSDGLAASAKTAFLLCVVGVFAVENPPVAMPLLGGDNFAAIL